MKTIEDFRKQSHKELIAFINWIAKEDPVLWHNLMEEYEDVIVPQRYGIDERDEFYEVDKNKKKVI